MDAVTDRAPGWEHRHPEDPIDPEDYLSVEDLEFLRKEAGYSPYCETPECFAVLDRIDALIEAIKNRG